MANILCIDTATLACSVALWKDDCYLAQRDIIEDGYAHAEKLHVLIDAVMSEAGLAYSDLHAIAIGKGPGSYTGLRIGVSAAKGLAYSQGIPLIALPTLQVMAAMAALHVTDSSNYILRPLLDARRMEVYSAAYDASLLEIDACAAHVLEDETAFFASDLQAGPVYFFGDGMIKCQAALSYHSNARFLKDIYPSAGRMGQLAQLKLEAGEVEDTAYFEPYYLKDYIAKYPKPML